VIRLGAVGDVVRTLPAVSALRGAYPRAWIAWLVEPPSASVVEGQPWIDRVLVYPRAEIAQALRGGRLGSLRRSLGAFLRELRRDRFDLAVDFHAILRSGILARLSNAPLRATYARPYGREGAWLFANLRARVEPSCTSRFARNAALVRFLGAKANPAPEPLRVDPEAGARIDRTLGETSAPVVIHPGTSDATPYKRWHAAGYARVARALASETGAPALVTAGPACDDRALADAIVAAAAGAARHAPPTPSLADLAALFARARLYVGSDTGPLHVASLVGTPVVQLLGPTHLVENEPWDQTPARTVRIPIACSPCRRGCAAATCMQSISPEAVIRAARELLAGEQGRRYTALDPRDRNP
jgi:ADP-heptose:LPS heptosyltransferase